MLGTKTKKFVRKITAIASAALMSGLSIGVATADLSSLTDHFITDGDFDAYVALGTGGATNVLGFAKDVAGAIVVASAFAQQATSSATAEGTAVLERNITTGYINSSDRALSFKLWDGRSVAMSWENADSGFSWLTNDTISNASNIVGNMTAILTVRDMDSGFGIRTTESGIVRVSDASIIYNLTFQDFVTGYNGAGKNTTGIVLPDGNMYKLTGWTTDGTTERITLGDFNSISATQDVAYDIGDTGATFEVTGYSTSPSDQLRIKVTGSDGTVLFHDFVSEGDEIYSSDDFTLNLVDYATPGGVIDATIEWSTGVLTLEEGNTTSAMTGGKNWTIRVGISATATAGEIAQSGISNDTNNISWIAWEYEGPGANQRLDMTPGTEVSFFGGVFKLAVDPLEINSSDKEEATIVIMNRNNDEEVRVTDENGTLVRVDLSPKEALAVETSSLEKSFEWYIGNESTGISYRVKCDNDTPGTFNLSRGTAVMAGLKNNTYFYLNNTAAVNLPYNLSAIALMYGNTSANCIGMKFNLTLVNFTLDTGAPLHNNLTYVGSNASTPSPTDMTDGFFNISELGGDRYVITLDNGTLDGDEISWYDAANEAPTNLGTGESYYSQYGTKVVMDSGSQVSIYYPDSVRVAKVSIGQSGQKEYILSTDEYDEELDVTLKSSSGASVSVNNVDVGSLAKLDTELDSATLSKPVILMGGWAVNSFVQALVDAGSINTSDLAADRGLVQLVMDAFNSQDALVIAGWTGDDTRLAAEVVASQVLGTDMGLTGSKTILNTGFDSYNEVTVV